MQSKTSSDCTTHGVRVQAFPNHIPPERTPGDGKHYFSYRIIITNLREDSVRLLTRKWLIINADGNEHVVEGEGVVGEFPSLASGESYEYSSFCPIDTEWGTMEGAYTFAALEDGSTFEAAIGRFYLVVPELLVAEEA